MTSHALHAIGVNACRWLLTNKYARSAVIKLGTFSVEQPFRIDEIARAPAPDGSDAVWHRYVISQGTNTIAGLRAGKHADVVFQVEVMVEHLNQRRMGKRPK